MIMVVWFLLFFLFLIPSGDSKTFIYMGLYGVPLIVLVVGVFALLKEGLKRTIYGGF